MQTLRRHCCHIEAFAPVYKLSEACAACCGVAGAAGAAGAAAAAGLLLLALLLMLALQTCCSSTPVVCDVKTLRSDSTVALICIYTHIYIMYLNART
jgi:hypothetical protein